MLLVDYGDSVMLISTPLPRFAMTMALLVRRHQSISADRAPNSAKYGSGNEVSFQ